MALLACLIAVSRGVACSNIATSSEGWHTDGDLWPTPFNGRKAVATDCDVVQWPIETMV